MSVRVDKQLAQLSATRLYRRGYGDENVAESAHGGELLLRAATMVTMVTMVKLNCRTALGHQLLIAGESNNLATYLAMSCALCSSCKALC